MSDPTVKPSERTAFWFWLRLGMISDCSSELAEAWLDGPLEVAALDWGYEQSRGNPRYLFELLRGALIDAALAREGGLWRLRHPPRPSRDLTELVLAQMADIGEGELLALELLALG